MLSFEMPGDYTFFLGHLISFLIMGSYLTWFTMQIGTGRKDKALHAGISSGLVIILLILFNFIAWPWWLSPVIVMAVGFGKEIVDRMNKKKQLFDWMDIVADLVGVGSVALLYLFSFVLS